ncbi:MAG: NAD-dependent protein deacetylase, family [Anaerocolumna sp.]|jgi:NAD-dependent deacetylase|nr:NAD-dependent protein deacetylase, family [Anaerocolumna sp.]
MNEINDFMNWIQDSNHIVFFGGAGVSTESGIPDFRSVDGLYNQQYDYSPETILCHTFFMKKTNEFFRFYKNKMICLEAKPNVTHLKLAELESLGKVKAVITQNIDGLHQMAGSKNVIELHGSVHRNYCMKCGKYHGIESIIYSKDIPTCECGGIIKPDVVLYEEPLKDSIISDAVESITKADMLIVGGTSLSVYPAAGLIEYYKGNKLVLINNSTTPYDKHANLLLKTSLGDVFSRIKNI